MRKLTPWTTRTFDTSSHRRACSYLFFYYDPLFPTNATPHQWMFCEQPPTSFHTCSTGFVPPPFDFAETGSLRGNFPPNFLLFHAKIDCQFKATNHLEKSSKHNLMLPKLLLVECCRRPLGRFLTRFLNLCSSFSF